MDLPFRRHLALVFLSFLAAKDSRNERRAKIDQLRRRGVSLSVWVSRTEFRE